MNFMYFAPNTKYYWRVRGKNGGGLGTWSEVWSFTTAAEGAVHDDVMPATSFQCVPNPVSNKAKLHFELDAPGFVSIRAFNMSGAEVAKIVEKQYSTGRHSIDWQPQFLAPGQYFLRLVSRETTMTIPMIRK